MYANIILIFKVVFLIKYVVVFFYTQSQKKFVCKNRVPLDYKNSRLFL